MIASEDRSPRTPRHFNIILSELVEASKEYEDPSLSQQFSSTYLNYEPDIFSAEERQGMNALSELARMYREGEFDQSSLLLRSGEEQHSINTARTLKFEE